MPSTSTSLFFAVLAAALVYFSRRGDHKRPPGPKPLPLIGNILDVPKEEVWKTFKDWSDKYNSDIVALSVFGQYTFIINNWEAAQEIFVKRAASYSSRPRLPLIAEVQGFVWMLALMPYGATWRKHRKMFRREIESMELKSHHINVSKAAKVLVKSLAESSENYRARVRHMTASITLETIYGLEVQQKNDPWVKIAEEGVAGIIAAGTPGSNLVDLLPGLQKLPFIASLPGILGRWKRDGLNYKNAGYKLRDAPFEKAKENYENGVINTCVASRALEGMNELSGPEREQELHVLRQVLGVTYAAGTDTTMGAYFTFILAMVLYPDVQKRAQAAIDEVSGKNRIATIDDFDSLPYIHALVQEVIRWQPVNPLALPHCATEDGFYGDIFIPKGATVLGNSWAMLRDESMFGANTDKFIPDRFLRARSMGGKEVELDPSVPFPIMAFGYGRRQCPGRHIAHMTLLTSIVYTLQVLDITRAKNEKGEDIVPGLTYSTGLASYPEEFPCNFVVRNRGVLDLMQTTDEAAF